MARCEDFPCCGHEQGCCPTFEDGEQKDMVCVCGARLPITSRHSICETCLRGEDEQFDDRDIEDAEDHELAADELLAQQELEDFEGLNGPFECYNED